AGASATDHLVGNIDADDLAVPLRTVADHARQDARCPPRAAAHVEHALSRTQFHQPQRLLYDGRVVLLHLLAAPGGGPVVELFLHLLVDGHKAVLGRWSLVVG